ncbi:MAG: GNAT family N-acetyltransferase [Bacteroidota bacterium]
MAKFEIRLARTDEIPLLAGIYQRAIERSCAPWYSSRQLSAWLGFSADAGLWQDSFQQTHCLVAVNKQDVPLAFGDMHPGTGQIGRLYVEPDAQGNGLGTAILKELELLLQHAGHNEAALESALNAYRFYLNRGYSSLGTVTLPFNGELFTQYRMLKQW